MKHKKSFKALWNVFLFVICGGSLIYGFVQHRKVMEGKLEVKKYQQQVDSLNTALDSIKAQYPQHIP